MFLCLSQQKYLWLPEYLRDCWCMYLYACSPSRCARVQWWCLCCHVSEEAYVRASTFFNFGGNLFNMNLVKVMKFICVFFPTPPTSVCQYRLGAGCHGIYLITSAEVVPFWTTQTSSFKMNKCHFDWCTREWMFHKSGLETLWLSKISLEAIIALRSWKLYLV